MGILKLVNAIRKCNWKNSTYQIIDSKEIEEIGKKC